MSFWTLFAWTRLSFAIAFAASEFVASRDRLSTLPKLLGVGKTLLLGGKIPAISVGSPGPVVKEQGRTA